MNKTEKERMTEYGITCKEKTVYSYKQHNYENLSDALKYAEIDLSRCREASPHFPEESDIVSS
ncbi:MAG: hypothetical protein OQL06_14860 [Gammaproteobacteria bacterium]|nr:hypothetical protein [Gammaproteobacteria bacterium]